MFFMRTFFFNHNGTLVNCHANGGYHPMDVNLARVFCSERINFSPDTSNIGCRRTLNRMGSNLNSEFRPFTDCGNWCHPVPQNSAHLAEVLGNRENSSSTRLKDYFVRGLLFSFLANLWGSNLSVCFFSNLRGSLLLAELIFIKLQQHSIFCISPAPLYTQSQNESYPWSNGFLAIYLSLKHSDPALLLSWLKDSLRVISMFAHLRFFSILGLLLKSTVLRFFNVFGLSGFSFYLVGKISVTGNAMSSSYSSFAGNRSNSSLQLSLASGFTIIRTSTGCLGFTLSFFF